MPPFGNLEDPEIERAFDWIVGFLEPNDWANRITSIENQLEAVVSPTAERAEAIVDQAISIGDDRIGWYLYLVDTALHDVVKTEPAQGSRVLPVFKRLGAHLDLILAVDGIEDRVERMLTNERRQPDGLLLELLVALLWRLNGWDVEFLPEDPAEKRPDIRAVRGGDEWFVECKRLQQNSDYSQRERVKWLAMWVRLREFLFEKQISAVFDIEFHVPLDGLPDDFLVNELSGKLRFVQLPCLIVENATWTVTANSVDYPGAQKHLKKYLVKFPGDQVNELIGGRRDPNRGFTCAIAGRFERMGEGPGNNRFLDKLGFAIGAFWSCDAPESIEKKARDIRRHVARAIEQLPDVGNTAVHVALETMDGPAVEAARHARILGSMLSFDVLGRPVPWVYCHLLQSYAPPNASWVIDETDYYFGPGANSPLDQKSVIVPPEHADSVDGFHWLREPP